MLDEISNRLEEATARGLAVAVSQAVREGVFRPGASLPPVRRIARHLSLSPTTVSAAWAMLVRAGTIRTDGRRGTFVAEHGAGPVRYRRVLDRSGSFQLDLATGTPDPALLPDIAPRLSRAVDGWRSPSTYLDEPVVPELEQVVRDRWPSDPERLTIVDGALDALQLASTAHLRFGDAIAVDHPCFPSLLDLMSSFGVRTVPVSLDEEGMRPEELAAAVAGGARAVLMQTRAQNPTGVSLTRRRARALCDVVRSKNVLVLELDSAGDISGAPNVSLAAWTPDNTMHIQSYSKSHGPDLRLAAITGPRHLVDPIIDRRFLGQGWTSRLLQRLLYELLTDADCEREVSAARAEYQRRRQLVVDELARADITVGGQDGLNIWIPVHDESAALLRLATQGIAVSPGAPFGVRPDMDPHIRVTTALISSGHADVARELVMAAGNTATAPQR